MTTIVVVFGNMSHGKDTLANMLRDHLKEMGAEAGRIAYATAVKRMVKAFVGCDDRHLWGTQQEKSDPVYYGRSARHYCQWLGTEIGRDQIHRDIWVHRMVQMALEMPEDYVVVSDGRFWNELRETGNTLGEKGRVIRVLVYRPDLPEPEGKMPTAFWRAVSRVAGWIGVKVPVIHRSESEVLEMRRRTVAGERLFDHVVVNDGDLGLLDARARQVAEKVMMTA